jgi:prevent-host-death family protein
MYIIPSSGGAMRTVTSTEFRQNASSILDAVESGETIRVSRHGRVIAQMTPALETSRVPAWKQPVARLTVKGASLTKAILQERRKDR